MKIFWSWQSDTPGKIGRFFVRDALKAAIAVLSQPEDVTEPGEREERIELDHDRKGVPGSPDLANTIFEKIENADVFVADVTLVGRVPRPATGAEKLSEKPLINSNVAIEYGHAHHSLGDRKILLVQNTHYGDREGLPFDLRHKAGPIQFNLSPQADGAEIKAAQRSLVGIFVEALRPYISAAKSAKAKPLVEIPITFHRGAFFNSSDAIGTFGTKNVDEVSYQYPRPQMFYLRLIPAVELPSPIRNVSLEQLVAKRELDVLSRNVHSSLGARNAYGAAACELENAATLRAFSQAFANGELWSVSHEFFVTLKHGNLIPAKNVENAYRRVMRNFVHVAKTFGADFPFIFELGAHGVKDHYLGVGPMREFGPIHADNFHVRDTAQDQAGMDAILEKFLEQLYDLAGVERAKFKDA